MTQKDTPSPDFDRRTFFKTAGVTAAGLSGIPMVGSAESSFREDVERAHRIREKTGSQKQFLKYLRKRGYEVVNKQFHNQVPAHADDGVSTQKLEKNDLTTNLTLVYRYYQCSLDEIYTEYSWDWNLSTGGGDAPKDYVSMGWPTDHYTYESQTGGDRVTHFDRDNDGGASVWEYKDAPLGTGWGGEESHSSYAGCYLTKSTTNEDRHIGAKYRHTWESIELTGWSYTVGPNGETTWAPQFSNVDHVWRSGYEQIYESEADYEYTNC